MRGKDREWQEKVNLQLRALRDDMTGCPGFRDLSLRERVSEVENWIQRENEKRQSGIRRAQTAAELSAAGLKPKQVEAAIRVFYGPAEGEGKCV